MSRCSLIIDDRKLPIFKKHLDDAKIEFKTEPFAPGILLLKIPSKTAAEIWKILKDADDEANRCKLN